MITAAALSPAVDKIYFVENFEAGKLYRVRNVVKSAGGKGINVARVASILGERVSSVGFKAGDTGEWLDSELKALGVNTSLVTVEGESRTNNNIIDRIMDTETEVLEIGPFISCEKKNEFLDNFRRILPQTNVLVCSGGLPEGISFDFYSTMIEIARPYNVKVILDTNGEILKAGIEAKPYIVKPNLRELGQYVNKKTESLSEIIEACRAITAKGVGIVAASMGAEGALMVTENRVLRARVPRIEIVNTIGSGDSMVAGLAAGIERNYSMEEMFRLGVASAVANTQFMEIGFVSREMIDRFLKEIEIEEL